MKTVKITISSDGATSIEAIGFKGPSCAKATAAIEAALGRVTAQRKKVEFHEQEVVKDTARVGRS